MRACKCASLASVSVSHMISIAMQHTETCVYIVRRCRTVHKYERYNETAIHKWIRRRDANRANETRMLWHAKLRE